MKYIAGLLILFVVSSCFNKLSEDVYYMKAKSSYANEKPDSAIYYFEELVDYYPESSRNAEALFMLGFINANDVKNFDDAGKYYTEFLEKYPEHELAFSAKYELENLGKDINELPIFKNIKSDTTAAAASAK